MTVYLVMAAPPLDVGASHDSVTNVSPAVAVRLRGADGGALAISVDCRSGGIAMSCGDVLDARRGRTQNEVIARGGAWRLRPD